MNMYSFFNLKEINSIFENSLLSSNFPHKNGNQIRESLKDHIILTNYIKEELVSHLNLNESFKLLFHDLFSSQFLKSIQHDINESEFIEILYYFISLLIAFHDLGKMNPKFQELKMNFIPESNPFDSTLFPNSNHSIYSEIFLEHIIFENLQQNYKNKPNLYQRLFFLTLFLNTTVGLHHISLRKISEFVKKSETTLNYRKILDIFPCTIW